MHFKAIPNEVVDFCVGDQNIQIEGSIGLLLFVSFHFISFHIFMEGGPSVITDLQGALRLHYTYITSKRKIITNMKTNYNV